METDGIAFKDSGYGSDPRPRKKPEMEMRFYPSLRPGSMKEYIVVGAEDIRRRYLDYTQRKSVNPTDPVHDDYSSLDRRLMSFQDWPKRSPMLPLDLARAGFFYAGYFDGILDCCKCFHCGQGVCMWETGDSAMGEHMRLSPKCPFIIRKLTTVHFQ